MPRFTLVRSTIALVVVWFVAALWSPARVVAHDGPCQWTGSQNTNWADHRNWSNCDGGVPQSHDDVIIPDTPLDPVIDSAYIGTPTVANVTLQGAQLYVDVGKTLTVSGQFSAQSGAILALDGTVNGAVVITAGTVTARGHFAGAITVNALATLAVPSSAFINAQNNVTVNGTLTSLVPTSQFRFRGSTFVNNGTVSATTTFDRAGAQRIAGPGRWSGALLSITGGSATALGSAVTMTVDKLAISNGGSLAIGTYALTLDGVDLLTVDGDSSVSGTGVIRTQGAVSLQAGGPIRPKVVVASGTTTTIGVSTLAGPVEVLAGAALAIPSGASLGLQNTLNNQGQVKGAGSLAFFGATLTNNGTITLPSVRFDGAAQRLSGVGSFANTSTVYILPDAIVTLGSNHQLGKLIIYVKATMNISGRTLALTASGAPLLKQGTFTTTNSTVVYKGTAAQSVVLTGVTYHHLTLTNAAGTSTGSGSLVVQGRLRTSAGTFTTGPGTVGIVVIDTGARLATQPSTLLNVKGTWANNGTFAPGSGSTVAFNGAVAQTVGGTLATTFANLTTANANGVTLLAHARVNGRLTLTRDLKTGTKTLTMPAAATSSGAGDVVGSVRRLGPFAAGTTYSFGNPFVALTFASIGTLPSQVTVTLVKAAPSGLSPAIPRRYKITAGGGSSYSATLRLRYLDSELNGMAEGNLALWRLNPATGAWIRQGRTGANTTENWIALSGVRSFGEWAIAP